MNLIFDIPSDDYSDGVYCDKCTDTILLYEGFYHCSLCEEDYCKACSRKRKEE